LRIVTAGRLLAAGGVLLLVVLALWALPSSEYIFLPDRAHPVGPLVTVQGGHNPTRGGVYFVDVIVRKATILERLFGGLHNGADLFPASEIDPPGSSSAQRTTIDLEDMRRSQQIAAAVALKALGRKVVERPIGVLIDAVQPGLPADGKLLPDDIITAVNGVRVTAYAQVSAAMRKNKIGSVVKFTIRRAGKTLLETMRTAAGTNPRRPIVGIGLDSSPAVDIQLPIHVSIDAGNVGGPSAGLAFALEVMEKLGRDVVHGHKIAATGEIFPDGSIGPIGGIKQKVIGAREAGVDAFLVPAGENAQDARKDAHGLRIIAVHNFQQALHALATLPPVTP
jgi:PDZ domain-containing protein